MDAYNTTSLWFFAFSILVFTLPMWVGLFHCLHMKDKADALNRSLKAHHVHMPHGWGHRRLASR